MPPLSRFLCLTRWLPALLAVLLPLQAAAVDWRPPQNAVLHIHFNYVPETATELLTEAGNADLIEIDAFSASAELILGLKQDGRRVLCYLNFGAWENWRPDAATFPTDLIGAKYTGWEGEYWLDIRSPERLATVMRNRIQMARAKGCDGIDPDNLNGYQNPTGFPLTVADQIRFNRWVAALAHEAGMPIGLKNGEEMVADLLDDFDWATIESCYRDKWCERFVPFVLADKAVFALEYDNPDFWLDELCPKAAELGLSAMMVNLELDGWKETCNLPLRQVEQFFDWAELNYPGVLVHRGASTVSSQGYTYRCYPANRNCIAVRGNQAWLAERNAPALIPLGDVRTLWPRP